MIRPTPDQSRETVLARGRQAATQLLIQRGIAFRDAESVAELERVHLQVERLLCETDAVGATAALMQGARHFDRHPTLAGLARHHAMWMHEQADRAFYDHGHPDAMLLMQLAAGLDPENDEALWGVLAPCLLGAARPHEALPYAVLAALAGRRDEVGTALRYMHSANVSAQRERSGEWPTAGGGRGRTGAAPTAVTPPLELVWRCDGVTNPVGGIAVSDGIALVGAWPRGSPGSWLHAVEIHAGALLWSYEMEGIYAAHPTVHGDLVFTGSAAAPVCLDLKTGREVWKGKAEDSVSREFAFGAVGCPLCVDDVVIFRDQTTEAYDSLTGARVFSTEGSYDPRVNASACAGDDWVYVPGSRSLTRIQTTEWKATAGIQTAGKVTAGPTLAGNVVTFCSGEGAIHAVEPETLEPVWTFQVEDAPLRAAGMGSAGAFSAGRIYVGAVDGHLYALDAGTGARVWKAEMGDTVETSPVVSGDVVYLNGARRGLCAFDREDGRLVWEDRFWEDPHGGPTGLAVTESLVLAGADRLYAFRGEAGD